MISASRSATPINKRVKELNIIYFFDAHRTKTLKFSMTQARVILALLVCTVGWAIGSSVLVTYLSLKRNDAEFKLVKALDRVFEYQIRFEQIFEKAYSDPKANPDKNLVADQSKSATAAGPVAPAVIKSTTAAADEDIQGVDDSIPDDSAVADAEMPAAQRATIEGQDPAMKMSAKAAPAQIQTSSDTLVKTSTGLVIEETSAIVESGKLVLKFALRSANPGQKADGVLFGVGKFVTNSGKVMYAGSPIEIRADDAGKARSPAGGFRYNIKHYKVKKLVFNQPATSEGGMFEEIVLTARSGDGAEQAVSVPVDDNTRKQLAKYTKGGAALAPNSEPKAQSGQTSAAAPPATTDGSASDASDGKITPVDDSEE
jgi:hypothetical protein